MKSMWCNRVWVVRACRYKFRSFHRQGSCFKRISMAAWAAGILTKIQSRHKDKIFVPKHIKTQDACKTTRMMLLAVNYLHSNGVVHRDLKLGWSSIECDWRQKDHLVQRDKLIAQNKSSSYFAQCPAEQIVMNQSEFVWDEECWAGIFAKEARKFPVWEQELRLLETHRLWLQQSLGQEHQDGTQLWDIVLCSSRSLGKVLHKSMWSMEPRSDCFHPSGFLVALLNLASHLLGLSCGCNMF